MMALLGPESPPASPPPRPRPRRRCARKLERCCCTTLTFFPLPFVYGLTSWAVWVGTTIGFLSDRPAYAGRSMALVGIVLFVLLNWSYTVAVFTDPGSPLSTKSGYSHLPTHEPPSTAPAFTVKSTGDARFCKKCQAKKPDRAHHCSTCKRCVLKMDHHCPWLATCLGLHNYKAFVLFILYTTLFCWVCFVISGSWLWTEVLTDNQYEEDSIMPVNYVLLAVLSGIIGLVQTGFTGWHLMLARRNQTTIECLESTRYLSPVRKTIRHESHRLSNGNNPNGQSYGQQFLEIHANTVPGVTRPEEGEERQSPIPSGDGFPHRSPSAEWNNSQRSYNDYERARQRDRYEDYLDEKDSERLPNAFDHGWRRNLQHLFGPKPLYWLLPICNTSGDGWNWEANPAWLEAREGIRREREAQWARQHDPYDPHQAGRPIYDSSRQNGFPHHPLDIDPTTGPIHNLSTPARASHRPISGRRSPFKADQILGRTPDQFVDDPTYPDHRQAHIGPDGVSLRPLRGRRAADEGREDEEDADAYDVSSDEEDGAANRRLLPHNTTQSGSASPSPARRGDKGSTKNL